MVLTGRRSARFALHAPALVALADAGSDCGPDHVVICWDGLSVFRVRGAYSRISPRSHSGGMCAIQTNGGVACAAPSVMPYGLVPPAAGPAG